MSGEALDTGKFEEPAKAVVRGEWSTAASLLAQIAATAASGNPFVGIAVGAGVEWLWATAATRSATAKLKQAEAEFATLDEEARVAFVQRCLREGFVGVTAHDAAQGVAPSGAKQLGELLEDGLAQVLRSVALLHGKVDAVAESVGPSPKQIEEHVRPATTRWLDEVDSSIAGVITLPRAELHAMLDAALESSRVIVLLGESGVGKSALAKAAILSRSHVCAVHALELQGLLDRIDLDLLRDAFVPQHAIGTFLVDGAEHLNSAERLRPLARLIRDLRPANADTRWRLVFTCRPAAWESIVSELDAPDALLRAAEIRVHPLTNEELHSIADSFPNLGALRTGIDKGALRKLKLLDLVARQPAHAQTAVGSNLSEAQLADWYWRHAIVRGAHGSRRGEVIKALARRRQETGSLRAPLSAIGASELDLLVSLQDEGVLRFKDETVGLAHDWLETVGLERAVMEAYGSNDLPTLVKAGSEPGWHASLQLAALHCLESDGSKRWLGILTEIRKDPQGEVASDLWSAAALDSSDVAALLTAAREVLLDDKGRALTRLLRRFIHRRTLLHPAVEESIASASAATRARVANEARCLLPIPDPCWASLLGWLADQVHAQLNPIHPALLDVIEIALNHERLGVSFAIPTSLVDYVLAAAERYIVPRERKPGMPVPNAQDFRVLLIMRHVPQARLIALIREAAGRGAPPPPPPPPSTRLPAALRPIIPRGPQEDPWPHGPNRHPDRFFRSFALTQPGASLLVRFDIDVACEIFLALLIQPPGDADRYDLDERRINDFHDISFPPFHDFVPAQTLFAINPAVAIRFVVTLADFAAERWLVGKRAMHRRWPGNEEAPRDDALPSVALLIDGESRDYLGDSQVFGWSRGVEVGPYAVKAALMALERWLSDACDGDKPPLDDLHALVRSAKSVAILGVLTDVALRLPGLLNGPLEPLVSCLHLYWWNHPLAVMADVNVSSALIGSRSISADLRKEMVAWHQAPHRKRALHSVVAHIYARRAFSWPALEDARAWWIKVTDGYDVDLFLLRVIAELDKANWRPIESDGQRGYEYVEPQELSEIGQKRSDAAGRSLHLQQLAFAMKGALAGETALSGEELADRLATAKQALLGEIEVPEIVEPIALAASVACVAIVRHRDWLDNQPAWRVWCRDVVLDQRARPGIDDHPWSTGIPEISAQRFAALALAEIWTHNGDDAEVREAVAAAVALGDGETVRLVLLSVAAHQESRRPDEILTLAVLAARVRGCLIWCRHRDPAGKARWEGALESLQRAFCTGTLGSFPEDWASLGTTHDTSILRGPDPADDSVDAASNAAPADLAQAAAISRARRAWDWQYIVKALASPSLGFLWDAESIGPNSDTILREMGNVLRAAWSITRDADAEWEYPSQVPRAVIGLAARISLHDASRRQQLLESWLRLPEGAAHWIAAFVGEAYSAANHASDSDDALAALVRAITANLLGAKGWLSATRARWASRRAIVLGALMGGGSFIPFGAMWPSERRALANSLESEIGTWLREAFGRNGTPQQALAFMLSPALVDLRLRSVTAIEPMLLPLISGEHADSDVTAGTVALLTTLWTEHAVTIERERGTREAFDRLLVAATVTQQPTAMALAEAVGQARRSGGEA